MKKTGWWRVSTAKTGQSTRHRLQPEANSLSLTKKPLRSSPGHVVPRSQVTCSVGHLQHGDLPLMHSFLHSISLFGGLMAPRSCPTLQVASQGTSGSHNPSPGASKIGRAAEWALCSPDPFNVFIAFWRGPSPTFSLRQPSCPNFQSGLSDCPHALLSGQKHCPFPSNVDL